MGEVAVSVEDVSKMFRLYHDRNQSLKAAVMRRAPGPLRGVPGARRRLARGAGRHHLRPDRRERLGQEHAAEVHGPDPAPRRRAPSP